MHRRSAIAVVVALLIAAALAPGSAAAADNGAIGDLFDEEDDDTDWSALANGIFDRADQFVTGLTTDETATDAADNARTTFNDLAATLQSWVNERVNASTEQNVLALTFRLDGSETTYYVTADVNNSSYENATMTTNTSRTVDESCTLSGAAARQADTELETFHDRFAEPGKNVTDTYLTHKAGEFAGQVDCTFGLGGA